MVDTGYWAGEGKERKGKDRKRGGAGRVRDDIPKGAMYASLMIEVADA